MLDIRHISIIHLLVIGVSYSLSNIHLYKLFFKFKYSTFHVPSFAKLKKPLNKPFSLRINILITYKGVVCQSSVPSSLLRDWIHESGRLLISSLQPPRNVLFDLIWVNFKISIFLHCNIRLNYWTKLIQWDFNRFIIMTRQCIGFKET